MVGEGWVARGLREVVARQKQGLNKVARRKEVPDSG